MRARPTRMMLLTAMALAAAVTALPAQSQAASDTTRSVTVFLRPANASLLDRLATTAGGADRDALLQRALPSTAMHTLVVDQLRGRGFTVTGQTSWTVTASAPGSLVGALFGARPALPADPTAAQRAAAVGALPLVPAALRGVVAAVFPTTGGPAVFSQRGIESGADLRNAYTSAGLTRDGIEPYAGRSRTNRLTIATIQFSGWNRDDLATYAHRNHLPYSSSTLTQVPVAQSSVPTTSDGEGAIEVALDQESLLATSPYARQRAYFAPNTEAGFGSAFSQVLDDSLGRATAYRGGDRHIAALSISWGSCETDAGSGVAVEPILKSLVAAGVTIFASSGDSGAYDCSGLLGPALGVDYPASSPEVVGVGGTDLSSATRRPNTGHNWSESAWSCTSATDCAGSLFATGGSGGSGGGESSVFAAPAYQASLGAGSRLVPDIAGDADPNTGFRIYTSQPQGPDLIAGGTSLASPVQAALLTNMLVAHGLTRGIGDIHGRLYAAARSGGTFRDITSGTNGAYDAGPGYDMVTGLGAPLWPAIGDRIFGGRLPVAHASWRYRGGAHGRRRTVALRWSGSAPRGVRVLFASVTIRRVGGGVLSSRPAAVAAGRLRFTGVVGAKYRIALTVTDTSHRISAARILTVAVRR